MNIPLKMFILRSNSKKSRNYQLGEKDHIALTILFLISLNGIKVKVGILLTIIFKLGSFLNSWLRLSN